MRQPINTVRKVRTISGTVALALLGTIGVVVGHAAKECPVSKLADDCGAVKGYAGEQTLLAPQKDSDRTSCMQATSMSSLYDSATSANTSKSWTSDQPPAGYDQQFINALKWEEHPVGNYVLKTGKIFGRWVAALQFLKNGQLLLTEYTPPQEYVIVVDPLNGKPCSPQAYASDPNNDGVLEIVFLHQKLNDPQYHMYTVYALDKKGPKLLWKSGGNLGDWLNNIDEKERSPNTWPMRIQQKRALNGNCGVLRVDAVRRCVAPQISTAGETVQLM